LIYILNLNEQKNVLLALKKAIKFITEKKTL